ncbi:uncharacterized protein CTHT_0059250 [Thermochaetoides thermophila DSM 1495]|uniref:Uncharacterized protein n=1 Tax=Chaetomium thermophilum (strain DSM 1495 / CBS 144.50 / IMI 039719) TaxID=759272 RepID=G0SD79_CHATD|nr:hypothetical protein CTHT_0059250 [Thermochaetoides thermophila DSM 1495]EGS19299.1 hypothetical protein CTHT_0059250 [Thermochaetoides thermophila DSM 1495]
MAPGSGRDSNLKRTCRGFTYKGSEINGNGALGSKGKSTAKKPAGAVNISDIHLLFSQDDDSVPIFDSCDKIRKKITIYLMRPAVTQAQLCRGIYAQLKGPKKEYQAFPDCAAGTVPQHE